MFRRFLLPAVESAVNHFFRENPRKDNPHNRELKFRATRNHFGGWSFPHADDARSSVCARRRAQIEAGQLRHQNGLAREGEITEINGRLTVARYAK